MKLILSQNPSILLYLLRARLSTTLNKLTNSCVLLYAYNNTQYEIVLPNSGGLLVVPLLVHHNRHCIGTTSRLYGTSIAKLVAFLFVQILLVRIQNLHNVRVLLLGTG